MKQHPGEVSAGAGSIALLLTYLLGGVKDPETLLSLGVVIGLLPTAAKILVTNGGVRGVVLKLWRGRA